jgi:flagellar FliL protein
VSAKPDVAEGPPAKSKKLLLIVALLVVVLAVAAGGAWMYISKQRAAADDGEEEVATKTEAHGPPTFVPLETMVVNLADPGGEKVAQIGVTLEVTDVHAGDTVKPYLPSIRSGVLLLISQRTAAELLSREGKDKLIADILAEAARPFGGAEEEVVSDEKDKTAKPKKKKAVKKSAKGHAENPVRNVLFSSFIVQ